MIDKKVGKDIGLVVLSNLVKMLSSVAAIFVIPLIFSKQDYGFYKLFLLYISYVGFFHFGFIDGIYLHYAGIDYEDLDKTKFKAYTKFMLYMEMFIALIIFAFSFAFESDRRTILMLVSLNLIALNFTSYYQFISQITKRFKEFAFRNILYTILNLTLIGTFFIFKIDNYIYFLMFTVLINFVLLLWYVYTYRAISIGKSGKVINYKDDFKLMFKLGIPLLLSNLVVGLMPNIPKQIIEIKFPIEVFPDVFSNFSFAFTLLGFTSVFLSAISIVIYPTLRKANDDELKKNYHNFNYLILGTVFIALTAYYPLDFIVRWILPDYSDSLLMFFILAPGIALTSSISVIKHNYFKTLNKNKHFLIIGISSLILMSLSFYITANYITDNLLVLTGLTVLINIVWYLALEFYLQRTLKVNNIKNIIFIIVSSLLFYSTYLIKPLWLSMIVYGVTITFIIIFFFFKELKKLYLKYVKKSD